MNLRQALDRAVIVVFGRLGNRRDTAGFTAALDRDRYWHAARLVSCHDATRCMDIMPHVPDAQCAADYLGQHGGGEI